MTDDLPPRVAVLEEIARSTEAGLARIDARLERLDARQDNHFQMLVNRQDTHFQTLITRHDRDFRWLVGLYLAGTGALLAVMARGFGWL